MTRKVRETRVVLSKGNDLHTHPVLMNDIGANKDQFSLHNVGNRILQVQDHLTGGSIRITREIEDQTFFID